MDKPKTEMISAPNYMVRPPVDYMLKERPLKIEKIENLKKRLHDMNCDIIRLLHQRSHMVYDISHKLSEISNSVYFFDKSYAELETEYDKNGLDSPIIQKVVMMVRNLIFDDTQTMFQNVVCTHLEFNDYEPNIMFNFVDKANLENGNDFSVGFPDMHTTIKTFSRDYISDKFDKFDDRDGLDIFSEDFGRGCIYIGYRVSDFFYSVVYSSLDFEKIKKCLSIILKDFTKFKQDYETYKKSMADVRKNKVEYPFKLLEDKMYVPLNRMIVSEFESINVVSNDIQYKIKRAGTIFYEQN